ncbi:MAG: DUF1616 domain-containing protein [Candidatus Saccharibacteria bacterium]
MICLVVAAAVLLSAYHLNGPVLWILAFLAVFFAPGYALVSALFPGQKAILSQSYMLRHEERLIDISLLERLALGFGLGATLMALTGSVLTRGILRLDPTVVGLEAAAFTFLFSGLAIYRRSKLPVGDQFALTVRSHNGKSAWTAAEKGTAAIIITAAMVLMVVTANGLTAHPASNPFSEFSVTGADGSMQHLPTILAAGQNGLIKVTVISHLGMSQRFTLTLSLEQGASAYSSFDPGSPVSISSGGARSTSFDLADGDKWEQSIPFSIAVGGQHTLYLRLNDGREVKDLWLPLTIT